MAIERRMQATRCRTRAQYLALLEKDPGEVNTLVSSMLIKLTTFFRDAEVWTALEGLLRELVQRRRGNEELRIWSAGCAMGEEAYSIAIAAAEALGPGNPGPELKVFGTDVDEGAIATARRSVYSAEQQEGCSPERLVTLWNHAAARMWNRNEGEVLGKKLASLGLPGLSQDLLVEQSARVHAGRSTRELADGVIELPDSEPRAVRAEVVSLRGSTPPGGLLYVVHDITALRGLEQNLQRANEELHTANARLLTTVEELRASEELETTNEELQSTNAELDATNRELAARTSEMDALSFCQRTIIRPPEREGLHSTHGRAHHDDVLVCPIAPGTPVQAAPEGVPCPARPPPGARKCRHPHPESRRLPGFRRFKCHQGHLATARAESGRVAFPWGPVALICLHRVGPERAWRPNTHSVPCCLPGEKNHVGDQGPRPRCGR